MNAAQLAYVTTSKLDREERDRLLMEQLPQVRYIARRIHERLPQHVPLDDLINAGIIGLMDALEKYEPSKNVQLRSYAKFRIRGAILDSLRELDWSPRELRRKARRIEEAERNLRDKFGRSPSEPEIAEELQMTLNAFQQLLGELRGLDLGSLQIESDDGGGEEDLSRNLPAPEADDPFVNCANSEMKALLASAVGELPERERQLLALYYFEELTMKEIGAVLGVVESRVSQMHSAAVIRLRVRMRELMTPANAAATVGVRRSGTR